MRLSRSTRNGMEPTAAQIVELDELINELDVTVQRALQQLAQWRQESAAHDAKPIVFDGVQPIEDEAVAMLDARFGLIERQRWAFEFPDMYEPEARTLLASVQALPAHELAHPTMKFAVARLGKGLRALERRRAAEARKREPQARPWDLWGISVQHTTLIGTYTGVTSLDAIAAGPAFLGGRVLALPHGSPLPTIDRPGVAVPSRLEVQS
jgi:hypothetical protein